MGNLSAVFLLFAVLFLPGAKADPRFSLQKQIARANPDIHYTHDPVVSRSSTTEPSHEDDLYTRLIVKAPAAWQITEGSSEVVVAVIDSGIEITHPDLQQNLWVNQKEANGKPGVDDDKNGYVDDVHGWDFVRGKPLSMDGTGHGTHCAGSISAARNGFGVVGVAPQVKVMGVRFINSNGSGETENAIRAMEYAVQNGAKILSNSWGGGRYDEDLEDAIKEVQKRGVIFVASANNSGRDIDRSPSYPATYEGVIAVGNSDAGDLKNEHSNFGKKKVFIFAPGTESLSTYLEGTYETLSGTSMAAPQVAAAFALAKALKPKADIKSLKNALCVGADPILTDFSKCGRLNLESFLQNVLKISKKN